MAKQYITTFVDDLTGGEATETVKFGLDGKSYEIDLNAENAATLRGAVEEFVKAARLAKRNSGRQLELVVDNAASQKRSRATKAETAAKREWLAENGWPEVAGKRGRLTSEQEEAYRSKTPRAGSEKPAEKAEEKPTAPIVEGIKASIASAKSATEAAATRKRSSSRKKAADTSPQESQEEAPAVGERTKIAGLSTFQAAAMAEFVEGVERPGATILLADGTPEAIVKRIEAARAKGGIKDVGTRRALAFVITKLKSGDKKFARPA